MDEFTYYSAILQNNTFSGLFVGQNIVQLKQIDSTNNYLKNQLSKSAPLPEGTVIMAEEQFAGRGQHTNQWVSAPGLNLTFSVLLSPFFMLPQDQFKLNIAVSLAINDCLRTVIGEEVKIKWPNDIYYTNRKLGGVLIENVMQGKIWKHAVVGIGINVNQTAFPPDIKNVTSIREILHQDYDLTLLLDELCKSLSKRYQELKENKETHLKEYLQHLFRYREVHKYQIEGKELEAEIVGVEQSGLLKLRIDNNIRSYGLKEISYLL